MSGGTVPVELLTKASEASRLIRSGLTKYSGSNAYMVQLTREAAYAGLSTSRLAELLGNGITRNSVIGLAHRAKPTILFVGTRHGKPMGRKTVTKRITKRVVSSSLNPRLSRLVVEARPQIEAYALPSATTSVINRRTVKPRCLWSGCVSEPRAKGKPYCDAHDKSIRTAAPLDFSRRIW